MIISLLFLSYFNLYNAIYQWIAHIDPYCHTRFIPFTLKNKNGYLVQHNDSKWTAIENICLHRGATLKTAKNCLVCPYHGWKYDLQGNLIFIPGIANIPNSSLQYFHTELKYNNLFISPQSPSINESIFFPPEETDDSFRAILGERIFYRPSSMVMENLLDMMHISFVHSFGNTLNPVPYHIQYRSTGELSGKTIFHYLAGPTSMAKLMGNDNVIVENEFHLPDTTITRVIANEYTKTILTRCVPVSDDSCRLFYTLYRNFLIHPWTDPFFQMQMKTTLDEDMTILNKVDKSRSVGKINTKFDITQMKFRRKKELYDKKRG
jgi:phenylpropionate dioxygenase-like ring-hydroxylating dioxygenase large terminal subunit